LALSLASFGSTIWPRSSILTIASTLQQPDAISAGEQHFSFVLSLAIFISSK
jgi:hypothetical protein